MAEIADLQQLASDLLRLSTPKERTLAALAGGLARACGRLQGVLAPVAGTLGFRTILVRAVQLASQEHPFLAEIAVYEDGLEAEGALARRDDHDYDEVRAAFRDVLAKFLEQLAALIGPELAVLFAREALAAGGDGKPEREKENR